jgi:DNA-binding response OmpR family regulator
MPSPPAILIVDDDPAVRRFMERVVSKQGWRTLLAGGGIEAVALMLQYDGPIPLAIVDLVMPTVGGLDFANQLRIDRPATKVLYISGLGGSIEAESLRQKAPQTVLQKPFTETELLDRIRALLPR